MTLIRLLVLMGCCVLAQAAEAAETAKPLPAGNYSRTLMTGIMERSYILHVPPQAGKGKPLPLVINLHGGGGNASGHQAYVKMDALADSKGFIVVYPNGTGQFKYRLLTWNAGSCCGESAKNNVNDVAFISMVLDDVEKRTPIDQRRVYATGMSNGAMMVYRLAIGLPQRIAAIAPVAGTMALPNFVPMQHLPILHIHSVDDPRALYYGGMGPPLLLAKSAVVHQPVDETLAKWARADGCATTPHIVETRHWKDHVAEKLSYAPCSSGAEVVHWRLKGPGHVWPGGQLDRLPKLLGTGTEVIDANVEMWNFFSRYSLPATKH